MKKFLSLIISISMVLSLSTTAFATTTGPDIPTEPAAYTVTVNEYDIYVDARNTSDKELQNRGVSANHIALVKSDAIENELLEKAALPADKLSEMGYNTTQIEILKNYTGEPIENVPELRGIFADMSAKFYKYSASTTSLKVRIFWEWTNAPALAGEGIADLIAIRWQGTNTNGQPINVAFNSANSSVVVNFYNRSGSFKFHRSYTVVCDSPYDHAYVRIPVGSGEFDEGASIYAKSGNFYVQVDRTGSHLIQEAAFIFAYGHTVILITPSLSIPPSFGIGFTPGTQKMVEAAIRMDNTGTITEY